MSTKTIDALLLEPTHAPRWVSIQSDPEGSTLAGLQEQVKGLIEAVSLGEAEVLWANEEGHLLAQSGVPGFGPNVAATALAVEANGAWSLIVGPVVMTGCRDGDAVSLPRDVGDAVIARIERARGLGA